MFVAPDVLFFFFFLFCLSVPWAKLPHVLTFLTWALSARFGISARFSGPRFRPERPGFRVPALGSAGLCVWRFGSSGSVCSCAATSLSTSLWAELSFGCKYPQIPWLSRAIIVSWALWSCWCLHRPRSTKVQQEESVVAASVSWSERPQNGKLHSS